MARSLRIGLYSPYWGSTVGGGEKYLGEAARTLKDAYPGHRVDLIGPVPADPELYRRALDLDLAGIGLVATNPRLTPVHRALNRLAWLRPLRDAVLGGQAARFTAGYDLLLAMVYVIPLASRARHSIVLCQFPYRDPGPELDGFRSVICQSEYVRGWVRRYWDREAQVLYPPVRVPAGEPDWEAKKPIVLSVGRFFAGGHAKRQDLMVDEFRRLCEAGLSGWELHLAGSVHRDARHAGVVERVRERAHGYPIEVRADISHAELADLYGRASIYWHAAGYGVDEASQPEALEHFGMTVAEAMGHGLPPIAFRGGGVTEVVGEDQGVLWRTPEELRQATLRLAADAALRRRLGKAARAAAGRFAPDRFRRRLIELVGPALAELEAG